MKKVFEKIKHTSGFHALLITLLVLTLCTACATPAVGAAATAGQATTTPASSATPEQSAMAIQPVSPTDPAHPADPVQTIIDGMSDEELLGQMMMLGFNGTRDMPKDMAALVQQYKIGGFMLFGSNVSTFAQTKPLITSINAHNPYPSLPLFIGLDVEGGRVSRLNWSPRLYSAQALSKLNDPQTVYDQFLKVGLKLKEIGVNINFAPVLDIAPTQQGPMKSRMYGTSPEKAIPLALKAIQGLHDGGVMAVGKHFPGHGMASGDSHATLPVIHSSKDELNNYTFKPFKAAIDDGIDAIMMGHLLAPALDAENPATLSKTILTDTLRGELGFKGLVFSDDMRMNAITRHYDIGEACIRFIEAGGDVVMLGSSLKLQQAALKTLYEALKSGRLTRERLKESAYRIISLKMKMAG